MTNTISCLQSQIALNRSVIEFFEDEMCQWHPDENISCYTLKEFKRMEKKVAQYARNQKALKKLLAREIDLLNHGHGIYHGRGSAWKELYEA